MNFCVENCKRVLKVYFGLESTEYLENISVHRNYK